MRYQPLRAGDTVSANHLLHIIEGVRARTLPYAQWTHQAHLAFAVALLQERGLNGAEEAAPDLIRAYNVSVGNVNDDTQGYHHTLTLFFLRRVNAFLEEERGDAASKATRLLASPLAESAYPLQWYSKDRLFSVEARRGWVAPDLKPMDG